MNRNQMFILCLAAAFVSIALAAEWTNDGGPYGGHVYALAMHPTNSDILYAGIRCGGSAVLWNDCVYKTTNCGTSWERTGLEGVGIMGITIDPANPDRIYAGTSGGFYKSTDAGATWSHKPLTGSVFDITIDPHDSQVLYVGTNLGNAACQKSINGGESWSYSGMPNTYLYTVLCDPDDSNVVYCGGESYSINSGFYKSTNAGQTWTQMTNGFPNVAPKDILADPNNPDVIYAGTYDYHLGDGIYKSTDNGESWTQFGLGDEHCWAVAVDPANSSHIHAGTYHGAYVSTDGGTSWSGPSIGAYASIEEVEVRNGVVFAGERGSGVYKSTDSGATWFDSDSCMSSCDFRGVIVNPDNHDEVFAAGWRYGVHKSTDKGKTWEHLEAAPALDFAACLCITHEPGNPQTMYVGTSGKHVWKTTDGGATWHQKSSGLDAYSVKSIAVTPSEPDIVYCSSVYDGELLYKSTDGGDNWFPSTAGLTGSKASAVMVDPINPDTVYAGTSTGVFRSTDQGASWIPTSLSGSVACLASVPVGPDIVMYAGIENSGIYKSTDHGANWTQSGLSGLDVATVAIDPVHPDTVYAGIWPHPTGGGVHVSEDGGSTWTAMSAGMGKADVRCLAIDPVDTRHLYAATMGGSVFRYARTTGIEEKPALNPAPEVFGLLHDCPSLFNPPAVISYQLSGRKSSVGLRILDVSGRLIRTLVDETREPGYYSTTWDGKDNSGKAVTPGVYFCHLKAGDSRSVKKLALTK